MIIIISLLYMMMNIYRKPKIEGFFSYIGNISQDHAFDNYVDCISFFEEKRLFESELSFLIATKSTVKITPKVKTLLSSGRLIIVDGKPMSNAEINSYYQQSFYCMECLFTLNSKWSSCKIINVRYSRNCYEI